MTYGRVNCGLLFLIMAIFALPTLARPGKPAPRGHSAAPAQDSALTLAAISPQSVQAMRGDGSVVSATITPSSTFLRNGLPAAPTDFAPGESVCLRLRPMSGGLRVILLSDPASLAAIARCRRRPLIGNVQTADAQSITLAPNGSPDGVPVTVRLSPKTLCVSGGIRTDPAAFGPGTEVAVVMRGLPDGLLLAVSISAGGAPPVQAAPKSLSGSVEDVQPVSNTLLVQDRAGIRHFVAVDGATRLKLRKQPAAFADIQPGMHVTVRFGAASDAAGDPIATSVSAF